MMNWLALCFATISEGLRGLQKPRTPLHGPLPIPG